jgi:hypothetical protein
LLRAQRQCARPSKGRTGTTRSCTRSHGLHWAQLILRRRCRTSPARPPPHSADTIERRLRCTSMPCSFDSSEHPHDWESVLLCNRQVRRCGGTDHPPLISGSGERASSHRVSVNQISPNLARKRACQTPEGRRAHKIPDYCSFFRPAEGGARDGGAAASSRKATTTYPTKTILAATTAEMAARVVEPELVSHTSYTLHHCENLQIEHVLSTRSREEDQDVVASAQVPGQTHLPRGSAGS